MDITHVLSMHPFSPAYRSRPPTPGKVPELTWRSHPGGVVEVGHSARRSPSTTGPRHEALLRPFEVADRLVTCGEWLEFIGDGGYHHAELWMSDGWATVEGQGWDAPLYWQRHDSTWTDFGLGGGPMGRPDHPRARRPSVGTRPTPSPGGRMPGSPPRPSGRPAHPFRLPGPTSTWTSSPHEPLSTRSTPSSGSASCGSGPIRLPPVPGLPSGRGSNGEYNGEFMVNQQVLHGSSFATPPGHARRTYRNFFSPGLALDVLRGPTRPRWSLTHRSAALARRPPAAPTGSISTTPARHCRRSEPSTWSTA